MDNWPVIIRYRTAQGALLGETIAKRERILRDVAEVIEGLTIRSDLR